MTLSDSLLDGPYFGLAVTILVYAGAMLLWEQTKRSPLAHPVLLSALAIGAGLLACGIDYEVYAMQTDALTLALGLVTVLLAVPLCRNWGSLMTCGGPCVFALIVSCIVSIATAIALPI